MTAPVRERSDPLGPLKTALALHGGPGPQMVLPKGCGPASRLILAAVARDDRAVMQAMMAACSGEHLDKAQALSYAVKHGHLKSLDVLLTQPVTESQAKIAVKLAVADQQWDAFRLLAQHVNPLPAVLGEHYREMLVKQAPVDVMAAVLHRRPEKIWIQQAFNLAVTWAFGRRLDMVQLLIPVADTRAKKSWALKEAIQVDNADLIRTLWPHSNHLAVVRSLIDEENWTVLDRLTLRLPNHSQVTLLRDYRKELPRTRELVQQRTQAEARVARAQAWVAGPAEDGTPKRSRYRP